MSATVVATCLSSSGCEALKSPLMKRMERAHNRCEAAPLFFCVPQFGSCCLLSPRRCVLSTTSTATSATHFWSVVGNHLTVRAAGGCVFDQFSDNGVIDKIRVSGCGCCAAVRWSAATFFWAGASLGLSWSHWKKCVPTSLQPALSAAEADLAIVGIVPASSDVATTRAGGLSATCFPLYHSCPPPSRAVSWCISRSGMLERCVSRDPFLCFSGSLVLCVCTQKKCGTCMPSREALVLALACICCAWSVGEYFGLCDGLCVARCVAFQRHLRSYTSRPLRLR